MGWFLTNWFLTALIINYIVALSAAFFLIRNNQNPRKTLSSLLFLIAFPFVGLAIYYFFGLEYRKSKIFKRKDLNSHHLVEKWNDRLFMHDSKLEEYEASFLEDRVKMVRLLRHNQKSPLTLRNDLQVLYNGENTFEAIFKAIKEAKDHIHLEYFIFNDDNIGNQFIDHLVDAAQRGIEVKLIYDSVGSDLSRAAKKRMTEAGIVHHAFMPVIFSRFTRKANYRNHRKICIVDGHIGFLGGVNVSDEYVNTPDRDPLDYWRDTHLRIEGHAVKSMQAQWLLNWFFVCDGEYHEADDEIKETYFPEIDEKENKAVQIAASGPDTDWANIMEAIFAGINSAEESIRITTPYFIPNEAILIALKSAARSGINVEIMLPRIGDSWAARYASRSYFEEIMESGIKIHWYCKGMLHAKTMVVDNKFLTIGTCNMDYRSFDINFEINALIFDAETAKSLDQKFDEDLKDCQTLDLEKWLERSKTYKFKESFCRLWAPLL
ncbi:cardiolipin synthetase [Nonlabens sp. YIK11]|uniref:cardiolipin synthase n=1 Tax=Nonlabens sp. YIK11 TaxID=1453349 RepID=UPI0006DC6BAE|nr:cardiolipin synthase [Nonlabens sp. YIK11]KQC33938.1 cardiolipin synthetase [Nonlabens sp. YIK11]